VLKDSFQINQRKRHGCLTVWLVIIILFSLAAIIIVIPKGNPNLPDILPGWVVAISITFSLLNIVFAVALFMWKKWGFWGFCAVAVVDFTISIIAGELFIFSLVGLCLRLFILYIALTIGGDNKAWSQLE
jgi:hypothetical protein